MQGIPQVTIQEAKKYASQWNIGGVTIIVDDTAIKFATDFANIVLKSFVMEVAKAQSQKAQVAQQAALPEVKKSSIILTDGD